MTIELNPNTIRVLKNIERTVMKAQTNFAPLAKTIDKIQKSIALPYIKLNEQIQKSFRPYLEINERITKQIQSNFQPYFRTIQTLQEHINNISKISGPIAFKEALEEVSRAYEEAQKETSGNQEACLNIVVENIEIKIENRSKGALNLDLLIGLLFSLILFVASLQASADTETRTNHHISQLEEKIEHLVDLVEQLQNGPTYYVVERPVNFRNKPSTKKSVSLAVLPVNLKVELVQRKNKWIFVRFFDETENIYKYGWTYKKYLKMLK